jgi:hypothetical protein
MHVNTRPHDTEVIVRRHLQAFLEHGDLEAIASDHAGHACLLGEGSLHRGRRAIRGPFAAFVAALPRHAIENFALPTLREEDDLAEIVRSAGGERPPGTDRFLVRNGKVVTQTFAMPVTSASH